MTRLALFALVAAIVLGAAERTPAEIGRLPVEDRRALQNASALHEKSLG